MERFLLLLNRYVFDIIILECIFPTEFTDPRPADSLGGFFVPLLTLNINGA